MRFVVDLNLVSIDLEFNYLDFIYRDMVLFKVNYVYKIFVDVFVFGDKV